MMFGNMIQDHLGDVVYVELPEVGGTVGQGANFGAVESVKATSDIISPVSGKVVEVNDQLSEAPGLVQSLAIMPMIILDEKNVYWELQFFNLFPVVL